MTQLWSSSLGTKLEERAFVLKKSDPYSLLKWLNTAAANAGDAQLYVLGDSRHVKRSLVDIPRSRKQQNFPLFAVTASAIAPTAPASLTATAVSETQVNLMWPAATTTLPYVISQYNVYRDGILKGAPAGTAYSDTTVLPWISYLYEVEAVDNQPLTSTRVQATVRTPDSTAPTPFSVSLTADESTISATWTASSDAGSGLTGYMVFLDDVLVSTQSTLTYSFSNLAPGVLYVVTVIASDAAGNETTATQSITTLGVLDPIVRGEVARMRFSPFYSRMRFKVL